MSFGAPVAAQSFESMHFDIARFGAACLLGQDTFEQFGRTISPDALAAQTGVQRVFIEFWSQDRRREHDIAIEVLLQNPDGDDYLDPPEPFLMILRQAQNDCQDYETSLRRLEAHIARLTAEGAPVPSLEDLDLADVDTSRMTRDRMTRLSWVIEHAGEAIDAGQGDALSRLVAVLARRPVPTEMIRAANTREAARALASALSEQP